MVISRGRKLLADTASYAALIFLSVFTVFPLVWMLFASFKTASDLTQHSERLLPQQFTLHYYDRILNNTGFLQYMGNSIVVSICATLIALALSALAAYAIIRFYPSKGKIFTQTLIMAYMFPQILLVFPFFTLLSNLGLTNSLNGLILTYVCFSTPFCVWMLTGYFRSIPLEIEEAARIDGASRIRTFVSIVLPLAAPGLVATGVYTFINAWNEFLFSLVLISTGSKKTLSVGLYSLVGGETMQYGDMIAASSMFIVPSLVFFFIIQRHIASGLTGGAVK
jgi:multiple sugar transport system permease protein